MNSTYQYLVRVTAPGTFKIVVHTGTRNESVAEGGACRLEVQVASPGQPGYAAEPTMVQLPPTNSTSEFVAASPVVTTIKEAGMAVVQLKAVPAGPCIDAAGGRSVAWFSIGWLDVLSEG